MGNGVSGPGCGNFRQKRLKVCFFPVQGEVVGQEALQFRMEGSAMIGVMQVREFMQEDVILQGTRDPHEIQVQVDVAFRAAGSPVGGVVLDGDAVEGEAVAVGEGAEPGRAWRKKGR